MSRQSSVRFVPSLETFEGRVNLSPLASYHLEAAWPRKASVQTDAHRETIEITSWSPGAMRHAADYSAVVFVGGWGSSL